MAMYTKLNLAAVSFTYPPSTADIKHCPCESSATQPPAQAPKDAGNFIRLYHSEASTYAYNRDSWLIRESRYDNKRGWHAPNDDLVADDAAPGSPVAAVGWWEENQEGGNETWETRVYYLDKAGNIRERINRTSFGSGGPKDDFDSALPQPEQLVPPTPGWKSTPLADDAVGATPDVIHFPKTTPLQGSKLAALKVDGGPLAVLYQATDESIWRIDYTPGNTNWNVKDPVVVAAGKAKAGTPLSALVGGWSEHRLFYVTPDNKLAGAYGDAHTIWQDVEPLSFQLAPSAMISAVAWNYATRAFEIRVYTTDAEDNLYEMAYSRHLGGWKPQAKPVAPPFASTALKSPAPGGDGGQPLSAVAAIMLEGDWRTKVYFHPRRIIIDEWDVCAKAPLCPVPTGSTAAAEKREIEEKTRILIKQKKEDEEKRKRGQPVPKPPPKLMIVDPIVILGSLTSAAEDIDDEYRRVDNLPFAVTLYGRKTNRVWISDNGIVSLDGDNADRLYNHDLAVKYRSAKRLPFKADDFSKYAAIPLWVDLKICKGFKHGVFYKVSGAAPTRTLTIEWLITQYKAEEDYYHFSTTFEESRPGVVTFKYNAIDGSAGTKCTVGVQGGDRCIQFSYLDNPRKIHPGLQLEFDTTKGTYESSRFTPTTRH